MSSIATAIELTDKFTQPMRNICQAVDMALSSFQQMSEASGAAFDTSSLAEARERLHEANAQLDLITDNTDEARRRQERYNEELGEGSHHAGNLLQKIMGFAGAYVGFNAISRFIKDCTDAYDIQHNAELQLMGVLNNMMGQEYSAQVDIETDVVADTTEAESAINALSGVVDAVEVPVTVSASETAFDEITAKASEIQSRGIYGDEAMIAGAAELATYFTDTSAITTMMDTLTDYAMGMTGGGAVDATAMVDYATNLGKIMSGSYQAMNLKGFEFTDTQKAIIEGEATREQIVSQLGEDYLTMSSDMQAAAVITQVIDESWSGLYETMSDTPQGKIIQMTNSLGDMKEVIGGQIYPYIGLLVDAVISHWPTIQSVAGGITKVLQVLLTALSWLVTGALTFADVIHDNWSWISPFIYVIVGALATYVTYLGIMAAAELVGKGIKIAMCVAEYAHAAATGVEAGETAAATAAQYGFNTALLACPITWIIVAIVALIAVVIALANYFSGAGHVAQTAFGAICGWVNVVIQGFKNLGLTVADIALGIANAVGALASNIMSAFHNAICSVQGWWYNMLSTALTVVEEICAALNKLPFVEFDYSGISSAAEDYAAKSAEAAGNKKEYQSIGDAFYEGITTYDVFQDGWVEDAYASGAAWGDGISDTVSNFISQHLPSEDTLPENFLGDGTGGLAETVGDIAGSASDISDSLDLTAEDLKYLLDIAEQEAINRFTTAEIKVEMQTNNTITQESDLDGIVDGLTTRVMEAMESVREGV